MKISDSNPIRTDLAFRPYETDKSSIMQFKTSISSEGELQNQHPIFDALASACLMLYFNNDDFYLGDYQLFLTLAEFYFSASICAIYICKRLHICSDEKIGHGIE